MKEPKKPLISIVVITFNSSKYVLETLESAKAQTYQNIELIVTDDCSVDNTLSVCTEWIKKNKNRFTRTEIISVEKNTGIVPNLNRGLNAVKGEWIKFIAGDDRLNDNCIERFYEEVYQNSEIEVIFSNVSVNGIDIPEDYLPKFFLLETKEQYLNLLKGNSLPAPAFFIKSTTLKQLNGFDEQFPFLDDYPLFIKILKSGRKLYYVNDFLVYYRDNNDSVSHSKVMNINYVKSLKLFYKEVLLPELTANKMYFYALHYRLEYLLLFFSEHELIKYKKDYFRLLNIFSALIWKAKLGKLQRNFYNKLLLFIS
ncbi:MAG TPA: glycosyltransferase [Paludibacteraceae bacterium]|nr:glycosyltransferase [Paludibacteraceae bacterium]